MVVFEADYDYDKLQNIVMTSFSDVIAITSPKNVTKLRHKKFSNLDPYQTKFLAAPVVLG